MSEFEFHVLNVGQGSANILTTPENYCLLCDIEGTSLGKNEPMPTSEYVSQYLSSISPGDESFDATHLLMSHHDDDHAGNYNLIPKLDIDAIWVPRTNDVENAIGRKTAAKTIEEISEARAPSLAVDYNTSIDISDKVSIDVLSPPPAPVNALSDRNISHIPRNDNSLCLLIEHDGISILYPGDAQKFGVRWIVDSNSANDIDVLIAPHHGSERGDYVTLLDHCSPDKVIISSAHAYQDERYGHPHTNFLKELDDRGITTYWTAVHGNVKITEDLFQTGIVTQASYETSPLDLGSNNVDQSELCPFQPTI